MMFHNQAPASKSQNHSGGVLWAKAAPSCKSKMKDITASMTHIANLKRRCRLYSGLDEKKVASIHKPTPKHISQKIPNAMRMMPNVSSPENIINLVAEFSIRAMMPNDQSSGTRLKTKGGK
jgi:hypothetical protein